MTSRSVTWKDRRASSMNDNDVIAVLVVDHRQWRRDGYIQRRQNARLTMRSTMAACTQIELSGNSGQLTSPTRVLLPYSCPSPFSRGRGIFPKPWR